MTQAMSPRAGGAMKIMRTSTTILFASSLLLNTQTNCVIAENEELKENVVGAAAGAGIGMLVGALSSELSKREPLLLVQCIPNPLDFAPAFPDEPFVQLVEIAELLTKSGTASIVAAIGAPLCILTAYRLRYLLRCLRTQRSQDRGPERPSLSSMTLSALVSATCAWPASNLACLPVIKACLGLA